MGIFFWGKRLVQFYSSYFQLSVISDQLSVTANHFPWFTYYILCFLSRGFWGFSKDVTVRFEKIS
ncbi:hypothetical protein N44_02956 [Microcystis aeruginosa NIES-44]|uniref:Uncharacterized protein n=1 Tax=Microcystis aeruginosa NIES-44 TaxID=449439 RepID=A0A0A1VYN8_MICAE|nr:hypothetical protein N44_02956 [Microcystis aeruginosa NIES-44]